MIPVFINGELYKQLTYKTKTIAKKQFSFFKKHGIINPENGEQIIQATFELI